MEALVARFELLASRVGAADAALGAAAAAEVKQTTDRLTADPVAMCAFYNEFGVVSMELDARLGTTAFLERYAALVKRVRVALKQRPLVKPSTLNRLSMPLRLAVWTIVVASCCVQAMLATPVLLPLRLLLKLVGVSSWSPFNFAGYILTTCSLCAAGVYVTVESDPDPQWSRSDGCILTCVLLAGTRASIGHGLSVSRVSWSWSPGVCNPSRNKVGTTTSRWQQHDMLPATASCHGS